MARYLGVNEFGIISLAISFTGIFGIFTDLGLNMLTVREVSRNKKLIDKYVGNTTAMKAVFSVLTLISILMLTILLGYDPKTIMVIFMMTLAIVISSFFLTFYSIFQAVQKMEHQAITTYMPSTVPLAILVWTLILVSLNGISANLLGSANKQMTVIKIVILGIVINVALSFFLIAKFSFIGASFATIITDLTVMSVLLYSIIRLKYADRSLFKDVPRITLSILIMFASIFGLSYLDLPFKIAIGIISYVFCLYLIETFDKQDLILFKRIFRIEDQESP